MFGWEEINADNSLYKINDEPIYLIDGISYENEQLKTVKYGLLQTDLKKYADRGQSHAVGHFFSLVKDGLIMTKHIFRDLRRPLYADGNMEGNKKKYIHTRRPTNDYVWNKGEDKPSKLEAPPKQTYVVIITKNENDLDKYPGVHGWIERWNWVGEDVKLSEAPINWAERYDGKIFTREG